MKKYFSAILLAAALGVGIGPLYAADIVDTAAADGSFKIFVAALKTSGLDKTLKGAGPYTLFAPTDSAFEKLPAGAWERISKDKTRLSRVLAYHVIPGAVLVAEVKPGKTKTIQGESLALTSDNGKVTVNGANVTQSDIAADNGVIHAIDALALPPE
ncbi:MAG: fasciclin domain-containing protein [Pseudomonadota bacterium]